MEREGWGVTKDVSSLDKVDAGDATGSSLDLEQRK